MSEEQQESYPCGECQAGVLSLQFITYFTWLDDELVTVPNFPAWVCDVCGKREYDERAVIGWQHCSARLRGSRRTNCDRCIRFHAAAALLFAIPPTSKDDPRTSIYNILSATNFGGFFHTGVSRYRKNDCTKLWSDGTDE